MASTDTPSYAAPGRWRLYLALTKPRVVALIVLTSIVGTLLAVPGLPPLGALFWGNLGIGLAAASAATLNQLLDQRIDAKWPHRPGPATGSHRAPAMIFACCRNSLVLVLGAGQCLTAALTFGSLSDTRGYTLWLKRARRRHRDGGAAGAAHRC